MRLGCIGQGRISEIDFIALAISCVLFLCVIDEAVYFADFNTESQQLTCKIYNCEVQYKMPCTGGGSATCYYVTFAVWSNWSDEKKHIEIGLEAPMPNVCNTTYADGSDYGCYEYNDNISIYPPTLSGWMIFFIIFNLFFISYTILNFAIKCIRERRQNNYNHNHNYNHNYNIELGSRQSSRSRQPEQHMSVPIDDDVRPLPPTVSLKTDAECLVTHEKIPLHGRYVMCAMKSDHVISEAANITPERCPYCSHLMKQMVFINE